MLRITYRRACLEKRRAQCQQLYQLSPPQSGNDMATAWSSWNQHGQYQGSLPFRLILLENLSLGMVSNSMRVNEPADVKSLRPELGHD